MAPGPADPSVDDWKALYTAAGEFKALAPWEWMADTDVFGVQNPETGEIGWCSVFGAAAQVYGLMVYAGTTGLFIHHAMATDQIEVEDFGYLQQGWLASFEDRGGLDGEARVGRGLADRNTEKDPGGVRNDGEITALFSRLADA